MIYKYRLKLLREREGISQKEMAEKFKIDRSNYAHVENEDEIMPIKYLIMVCNYFDVSIDYMFGFTDIKQYNDNKDIDLKLSGQRLKEFRKEIKKSQNDLASILGCSFGTISGYEIGRYIIATPFLYDICKKYKISADYLLGKTNTKYY